MLDHYMRIVVCISAVPRVKFEVPVARSKR